MSDYDDPEFHETMRSGALAPREERASIIRAPGRTYSSLTTNFALIAIKSSSQETINEQKAQTCKYDDSGVADLMEVDEESRKRKASENLTEDEPVQKKPAATLSAQIIQSIKEASERGRASASSSSSLDHCLVATAALPPILSVINPAAANNSLPPGVSKEVEELLRKHTECVPSITTDSDDLDDSLDMDKVCELFSSAESEDFCLSPKPPYEDTSSDELLRIYEES